MRYLICIVFLLVVEGKLLAQTDSLLIKLQEASQKYDAVGLAFAVVKEDSVIYDGAVGFQSLETKKPLSSQLSLFRIASISKSFTATALMQLVENGQISLDDDVGDLLGFAVRNPNYIDHVITLRMLLSHTSSLSDSNGYFDVHVIDPQKNNNWKKGFSNNKPGSTYDYCNLNYNLAGAILENVTGVRFDNYIKNKILNPLQLSGGYCVDSLRNEDLTVLYNYDSISDSFIAQKEAYNPRRKEIENYILGISTPIFSPTGGMKISIMDLAKYMRMHMNYGEVDGVRLLSNKSSKLMQTKYSDIESYGLGLRLENKFIDDKILVGHTGSAYGLYSAMFFSPEDKVGIVIVTNGCKVEYHDGQVALLKVVANLLYQYLLE